MAGSPRKPRIRSRSGAMYMAPGRRIPERPRCGCGRRPSPRPRTPRRRDSGTNGLAGRPSPCESRIESPGGLARIRKPRRSWRRYRRSTECPRRSPEGDPTSPSGCVSAWIDRPSRFSTLSGGTWRDNAIEWTGVRRAFASLHVGPIHTHAAEISCCAWRASSGAGFVARNSRERPTPVFAAKSAGHHASIKESLGGTGVRNSATRAEARRIACPAYK